MNDRCRNEAGKKTDRLGSGEEGVYDCDIYRNGEARKKRQIRFVGGRKTRDECMSGNTQMGIFCYN